MLPSAMSLSPHPGTEIVPSCLGAEPVESFSWAASGDLSGHAGSLAASNEFRPAQLPGVSELTTTVDLRCPDGRTGNAELPLHVVQSPRLVFLSYGFCFLFAVDLNMLYTNQIISLLCFITFFSMTYCLVSE